MTSELTKSAPPGIQDHVADNDFAHLIEFGNQLADTAYGALGGELLLMRLSIMGSKDQALIPTT